LDEIHALHLSRHSSADGGDRDRSLRALGLAHKYLVPKPAADAKPILDEVLGEMTTAELQQFATSGRWPARFAPRLRALGWTVPASAPTSPSAEALDAPHDDRAGDRGPWLEKYHTERPHDGNRAEPRLGERAGSDTTPAAPLPPERRPAAAPVPEPEPMPARAPERPMGQSHAWKRPEGRVYSPPRPPDAPPASAPDRQGDATSKHSVERDWAAALDAYWKHDRLPGW
jgi:hypothetical protein